MFPLHIFFNFCSSLILKGLVTWGFIADGKGTWLLIDMFAELDFPENSRNSLWETRSNWLTYFGSVHGSSPTPLEFVNFKHGWIHGNQEIFASHQVVNRPLNWSFHATNLSNLTGPKVTTRPSPPVKVSIGGSVSISSRRCSSRIPSVSLMTWQMRQVS